MSAGLGPGEPGEAARRARLSEAGALYLASAHLVINEHRELVASTGDRPSLPPSYPTGYRGRDGTPEITHHANLGLRAALVLLVVITVISEGWDILSR